MGTGVGIGTEMVESENVPTDVLLEDEDGGVHAATNFSIGQGTMLVRDESKNIWMTGLKMHYTPKLLRFDPEILNVEDVRMMECGRKHYILVTEDNNLWVWGNIFKERADIDNQTEGFALYPSHEYFDGGLIKQIEARYMIFGALIEN